VGRPVWVDDPHFHLEYHLRHTALPAPGGREEIERLMGRLMSQPLDRSRPLWETWVVEGIEGGRWGLVSKIHHCMVDGVSGTDLMSVVLDTDPEAVTGPPDDWQPAPEPSDAALVIDALGDLARSPYEQLRWARSVARSPEQLKRFVGETAQGLQMWTRRITPTHHISIEGRIGPHRRWTWASIDLAEVKRAKAALGGTVNDLVLTVISGGFRSLLEARGDDVDHAVLRSLVPVSVRASGDHTYNNQVSAMVAELPVHVADPVERLAAVRAQMGNLKESHQAVAGEVLSQLTGFAPPMLLSLGTRAAVTVLRRTSQRSINTVTTNVPGPQVPIYACGRRMTEYLPYVPISPGVQVGVAILSYAGRIAFGITGDLDAAPDIHILRDGIERDLAILLQAADKADAARAARAAEAAESPAAAGKPARRRPAKAAAS
jgi:diacylglycerol O-acyltransferase / wax synthase